MRYTLGRICLECPSGGLDGEPPQVAALRELEEETGYKAAHLQHLGRYAGSSGVSNIEFDIYLAKGLSQGTVHREETEEIEIDCIPLSDLRQMVLQGELDNDVTEMFQKTINDIIAKPKAGIVLDMSNVGFIDSVGLEKLLWARDYCSQNKRELRLAGLDENCMKILEITRLENELDHYAELTEAVRSFA